MKNKLYQDMYEWYKKGYSLAEVGKMFGMSRQSVYGGFKNRKLKLRKQKKLPFQTFNNIKFTPRKVGYYGRTNQSRGLMHRYVWEFYNGKIPKGYELHHKNKDKTDNRISNLELYTKSEHARRFNSGHNQYTKKTVRKTK